jgi:hypothetical protein
VNWNRLNFAEPAVLRGIIAAVVSLAAALGFVIPADITGAAEAAIPTLSFLIPLALSLWTRAAVFSPAAVHRLTAPGTPQTPGVPDHAA